MNNLIDAFEQDLMLRPAEAAKVLGVAYSTYAAWKNGSRELPKYIEHSIKFVYLINEPFLSRLLREILEDER